MKPAWEHAQTALKQHAWRHVLRPLATELTAQANALSVEVTAAIGRGSPDLLPDAESFEANRASTEASILGFAHLLWEGEAPDSATLGPATLAYAQEGAQRGVPLTVLIRGFRLGHAAVWERLTHMLKGCTNDPDELALATELCSAWLFGYVDAALCLADDYYSAERERFVKSTAATRADTINTLLAGEPIETALASRRLGYELERQHLGLIAWLEAHEEGTDTHAMAERAIQDLREQLVAESVLIQPLGVLSTAAWISTRQPVPEAKLDDLRFDTRAARGVRVAIGEPGRGIAGFRQTHGEAAQARRVAGLVGRPPGTITPYGRVSLAAIATTDLPQARTFVQRQLRGLTNDDDATRRLAATLRTYLDEHSSRSRTAKRLGIHENTVSYRIRQAEETLGRSVDQHTLELRVALALANVVGMREN